MPYATAVEKKSGTDQIGAVAELKKVALIAIMDTHSAIIKRPPVVLSGRPAVDQRVESLPWGTISIMYDLTLAPAALASRPPPVGVTQLGTVSRF